MNKKIAFFDAKSYDRKIFNEINQKYDFEIKYHKYHLNQDTAVLAKDADAVCAFVNDDISADVINTLKSQGIKIVALRSAGYNNVDLKAAYKNLHVVRVPAYSPYAVAEHTVALILSLNRKIHRAYYRIRDNNFTIKGFLGFDMHGKTAGIIGTGKIGLILIGILRGFGMNVLAYDPFPNEQHAKTYGFTYTDLDSLYKKSDIISLNCPLTKETYHMINEQSIAKMKKDVMIINTGRGALIDTKALTKALKENRVGSAGLDVYEEESKFFFEDHSNEVIDDDVLARLLTFNNVLITSHQGFFTREALTNIATTTLQNLQDFFEGNPLVNEVCYRCNAPNCNKEKNGRCFVLEIDEPTKHTENTK